MVPVFTILKAHNLGSWVYHKSYWTYEEAEDYLKTSSEVTSYQYWKIEKVWSWPF